MWCSQVLIDLGIASIVIISFRPSLPQVLLFNLWLILVKNRATIGIISFRPSLPHVMFLICDWPEWFRNGMVPLQLRWCSLHFLCNFIFVPAFFVALSLHVIVDQAFSVVVPSQMQASNVNMYCHMCLLAVLFLLWQPYACSVYIYCVYKITTYLAYWRYFPWREKYARPLACIQMYTSRSITY